jgi:hypothetical protein
MCLGTLVTGTHRRFTARSATINTVPNHIGMPVKIDVVGSSYQQKWDATAAEGAFDSQDLHAMIMFVGYFLACEIDAAIH